MFYDLSQWTLMSVDLNEVSTIDGMTYSFHVFSDEENPECFGDDAVVGYAFQVDSHSLERKSDNQCDPPMGG